MQTTMKKNNLNPAWKESFDIDWHGEEIIQIECWDHNKVSCYSFDVIQSTVRLKYTMKSILTRKSLQVNYIPLLCGNADGTPTRSLGAPPQCSEAPSQSLKEPTKRPRSGRYMSPSENFWSEWVSSYLRNTAVGIMGSANCYYILFSSPNTIFLAELISVYMMF